MEIERSVLACAIIICGVILELRRHVSRWNLENIMAK